VELQAIDEKDDEMRKLKVEVTFTLDTYPTCIIIIALHRVWS